LKVLIYNGWTNVGVPITEADAQQERERIRLGGKPKVNGKTTVKRGPQNGKAPRRRKAANGKGRKPRNASSADLSDDDMDVDEPAEPAEVLDWCSYINTFDVCITTYNVLRSDFNVARTPPERPRREDVKYSSASKPISPLVMCEWYRVIMDEVQMAGGGNTE
jgi:E3 ubiquitin-protein ligase SHPRH